MSRSDALSYPSQRWFAERYAANARYVADLAEPLIDLLAPVRGELVLDLGCGDGVLGEKIAARGCRVVGADASLDQARAARAKGISTVVLDGGALAFDAVFDAVFSNAALHWMKEPAPVIDGVWRALRPGGRFVAEMGGAGNIATIAEALVDAMEQRGYDGRAVWPWYFPTPEEYRTRLELRGFRVADIELIPRPTILPCDMSDWLDTFAESFILAVRPDERQDFVAQVREALRPVLQSEDGRWVADYVRLRFVATRPA